MAIIRGPDGKPIGDDDEGTEATTRRVERRSIKDRVSTKEDSQANPAPGGADEESDVTDPAAADPAAAEAGAEAGQEASAGPALSDDGSPATQIIGARKRGSASKSEDKPAAPGSSENENPMDDPVVGWVVVIEGPGQGASVTLGYGMNSIGRAPSERISLDFGDSQISRTNHAAITYDPRGRKYFVAHGGGKNLTYLGDEPVLMPIELKGGEEVMVGDTKLRFVPFCGEKFDWRDK